MIKAVIFDWDGVLIDDPTDNLMQYCAKSLNVNSKLLEKVLSQYKPMFQKGRITENELWAKICHKLKIKKPKSKSLWTKAVKQVFSDKGEMYNLIKILKSKGYKIGFLSNTEIPAMNYFFKKGYDKYFNATTFSCLENTVKPERKIYLLAINKLRVKPAEAIFIDDKAEYVVGAKKAGLNGIVFKSFKQLAEELALFLVDIDLAKVRF